MNIRKAHINDFTQINELFWQSDLYHFNYEPYIYEKTEEGYRSEEYIKSIIEDKKSLFIVLEIENKVIGFLLAYEEEKGHLPFHKKRRYLVLDNIVVDEKYQKNGYGQKLLDYLLEYSKENKYSDILLNVYCFNEKAIKLYEKYGFKKLTQDMILKL